MSEKKEEKSKSEQKAEDKIYRLAARVNKLFFNFLLETTEESNNSLWHFADLQVNEEKAKRVNQ